jgi:hypothetical protein
MKFLLISLTKIIAVKASEQNLQLSACIDCRMNLSLSPVKEERPDVCVIWNDRSFWIILLSLYKSHKELL